MGNDGERARVVIFRDIRRYYCEYCGICRSKKALINSHIISQHQEKIEEKGQSDDNEHRKILNTCDECGASFQKPAHLKQHMQSHSIERPFTCTVDDCHSSYRRKDHLTRHMLQHQGKLFSCAVEDCKRRFTVQGNMKRHMKEFHGDSESANVEHPKEYVCSEPGCGKVFKYPSKLRKHEDSHGMRFLCFGIPYLSSLFYFIYLLFFFGVMMGAVVYLRDVLIVALGTELNVVKLETVEALCSEPGCMKYFTNEQCLKEHYLSCHQHVVCDKCGTKQLKKNMKRHLHMHEAGVCKEKIKCSVDGCVHSFSTRSNLNQHIKAAHLDLKPFSCSIAGCHMKFAFKHVRDKHEKSGTHVYTAGNFEESDEQFRSRPRGGRKRKLPPIEILLRKRVVPPSESDIFMNGGPEEDPT